MQDISLYTGVHVNGGPEAISKGSGPVRLAGLFFFSLTSSVSILLQCYKTSLNH